MTFVWKTRVYWEDTDAGGVVYYANYLKFMERARTEWLRTLGFGQAPGHPDAGQTQPTIFVVRRVEIDYCSPARLDDEIVIETTLVEPGRAKLVVQQRLHVATTRIADAVVTLACVEATRFKPVRIPATLIERLSE